MIKIAETIATMRKEKEMSQQQLAKLCGVSIGAVSKWERGAAYPSIELLPKLARFFGISIDALIGYDMNAPENNIDE